MEIRIVRNPLALAEIAMMASAQFGDMIKAVVDVEQGFMALGGELHVDAEALLLEQGSKQANLWGINLYPGSNGDDLIEFDSMVNIRPSHGNRSRGVEDPALRAKLIAIVHELIIG